MCVSARFLKEEEEKNIDAWGRPPYGTEQTKPVAKQTRHHVKLCRLISLIRVAQTLHNPTATPSDIPLKPGRVLTRNRRRRGDVIKAISLYWANCPAFLLLCHTKRATNSQNMTPSKIRSDRISWSSLPSRQDNLVVICPSSPSGVSPSLFSFLFCSFSFFQRLIRQLCSDKLQL